jgi:DNA-binding response OmpR family regulator
MSHKQQKILLVEDELSLAEIIKDTLEIRGFVVLHAATVVKGMSLFQSEKPDLVLLDITLPDGDGYGFARMIRKVELAIPIIFLTSRSLPEDVVKGFESGANDYVKKPFSIEELIVRIRALLSKEKTLFTNQTEQKENYSIGAYTFYYQESFLERGELHISLTWRESELLKLLVLNHKQVLSRKVILEQIWGADDFFAGRSMDVFITKLRKYLKADPSVRIMNIRGVGYKLLW